MKRKGFTLIELLAVIVILAVIMVIAVPKILDVIESSRESAADSSIKLVKDAIKTQVTTAGMAGVTFEKTGECYLFDFENNNENAQNLSLKNKERIGGSIKYCNGKFEEDTLTFDGELLSSSDEKVCIRATKLHEEECTQTDATSYCSGAGYTESGSKGTKTITYGNNPVTRVAGTLTSGDAFDCDVTGTGNYERFYYVTDLEGNSNVAVLIYYNNFVNGAANNTSAGLIAYDATHGTDTSAQNWYGPVTAITNLPTKSQWRNVSLTNSVRAITNEKGGNTTTGGTLPSSFSYEGYAARLLTYQEMTRACGTTGIASLGYLDSCNYLTENTKYSSDSVGSYGYWLENSYASNSTSAWRVRGNYRGGGYYNVSDSSAFGVRPAIEVSKTDILY